MVKKGFIAFGSPEKKILRGGPFRNKKSCGGEPSEKKIGVLFLINAVFFSKGPPRTKSYLIRNANQPLKQRRPAA